MGKDLISVVGALLLVSLPLYLSYRLFKRWRSMKSTGGAVFEFLVIVCTLFILAAIAIPDFLQIQDQAKLDTAKSNLGSIHLLQMKYHTTFGAYAGGPDAFKNLDWKPYGLPNYSYYCGDDFIPNTKGDPIPRSARPSVVGSSATGFTCAAVGNVDNDPELDIWTIDDAKQLTNVLNDI